MDRPERASGAHDRQIALQQTIEGLLQIVTPSVANAIRLGAIPHWVDNTLLLRLAGAGIDLAEVLDTLLLFHFARLDSQGRLHYRDEVRDTLLAWQRHNSQQEYLSATHTVLAYFEELAKVAPASERPGLQREALFHTLILDETSGIHLLNEKLEEACYYRQLGTGEMLVAQAAQLRDQLSVGGMLWLKYFEACLDLVYWRKDKGEAVLEELVNRAHEQVLQALARWKLGQLRVKQQLWSKAIRLYKDSLKELSGIGEKGYHHRARVMMSLGDAYRDLADQSGGFISIESDSNKVIGHFMNFLKQFPFLAGEWVARRISFLPNLFFGTNYLLQTAARWFRQAEHFFAEEENPLELTEARLALAKVEHQMGRWSRAQQKYTALEKIPSVNQSRYRTAKVRLGQGQAKLEERKLPQGIMLLEEAIETFRIFQDAISIGTAAFLIGTGYENKNQIADAAKSYLESAEAFRSTGDHLALTKVIWNLERLSQSPTLPIELKIQIDSLLSQVSERHSLTRFPRSILLRYRKLMLFLALPISYAFALLMANIAVDILAFSETLVLSSVLGLKSPIFDVLIQLGPTMFFVLLAFWIYRLIYISFGRINEFILGYRLNPIEYEQPEYWILDKEGISLRSGVSEMIGSKTSGAEEVSTNQYVTQRLAWAEITDCVTLDSRIGQQPIHLISRTLIQAGEQALVLEGNTAGYEILRYDIQKVLMKQLTPIRIRSRDFTFLEWKWILTTLLFSFAIVIPLYRIGQIAILGGFSEGVISLPISSVVTFTIEILGLALPTTMLWQFWDYQRRLRKDLGGVDSIVPGWLIFITAILMTLSTLWWIFNLAFHP